jgi:GNAT superfamily N-acetyltransferase
MLSGTVTIGRLSNAESRQAVDLILPIQREEFGVPITIQDQPDLLDIDGYYNRPGGGFWGAFRDHDLAGTIALINAGHATGVIRKMFVKKELRGKEFKIAQQLIETLIAFSRTRGITDLYLGSVDQMKAAHRFYERNGFQRIAPEDLPKHFPRMALDTVFYHLQLSQ